MIVKPHPVQKLERVKEIGALLEGDFINVKMPDGFNGEICLVGDRKYSRYNSPIFARMAKNGNGNYVILYEGLKLRRIRDGKAIVSETHSKDISRASPKYYWLKKMLTKCEVNDNWRYTYG